MNVIIKNNDDSYFYLFKLLSNKFKFLDNLNNINEINILVCNQIDNFGYIKDTKINIEEVIKDKKINLIIIEEESVYSKKLFSKYKIKYKVLSKSTHYNDEINKLRSIVLLKFILDENKESIYNLKFLILGKNNQSVSIINLLHKLNASYDEYNNELNNVSLLKYDIIVNTDNIKINPELLFDVKKNLIIYDLEPFSKIDYNLLYNNYIKYRYINNVSLYYPSAKANILLESMREYDNL